MSIEIFPHLSDTIRRWGSSPAGDISVATPYLTEGGLRVFINAVGEEAIRDSRWLVSLNLENAIDGATEPDAVQRLMRLGAKVKTHSRLHAKLYLFRTDGSLAFGSANLTRGGLDTNEEIVAWVDEAEVASRAVELFETWWAQGEVVTGQRCSELQGEAASVAGLQAQATAMMRLMGMGAFVTVTTPPSSVQQQHSLSWQDVGVPDPGTDDIRPAPPTLLLWPKAIRDAVSREMDRCRRWVRRHGVQYRNQDFVRRALLPELDSRLMDANCRVRERIASIPNEEWRTHRVSLEAQLRAWLSDIARDQRREPGWVDKRVDAIVSGLPQTAHLGAGIEIIRRLEVPHPDSVPDSAELVDDIAAELRKRPVQMRLEGLSCPDAEHGEE